jgi:hypothetical protein
VYKVLIVSEPLTVAQDLHQRYGALLHDPGAGLDGFTLRRILRDAELALLAARGDARTSLDPASEVLALNVALCHLQLKSPTAVLNQLGDLPRRAARRRRPLVPGFHAGGVLARKPRAGAARRLRTAQRAR